jgi:Uma2 family endonuclease
MGTLIARTRKNKPGMNGKREPAWEVATFFPMQGDWTEEDYIAIERESGNRMIELVDGYLEVLPMPSLRHQRIAKWMLTRVDEFIIPRKLGEAQMAPLPVKLFSGQIREPDIVFFESHRIRDLDEQPLDGADLVMEVPSRGKRNRKRDLITKRRVYAKAKIREYWIIDPETQTITVLTLSGKTYKTHGVFKQGEDATSKLLKGFKVAVSDVFAAGEGK